MQDAPKLKLSPHSRQGPGSPRLDPFHPPLISSTAKCLHLIKRLSREGHISPGEKLQLKQLLFTRDDRVLGALELYDYDQDYEDVVESLRMLLCLIDGSIDPPRLRVSVSDNGPPLQRGVSTDSMLGAGPPPSINVSRNSTLASGVFGSSSMISDQSTPHAARPLDLLFLYSQPLVFESKAGLQPLQHLDVEAEMSSLVTALRDTNRQFRYRFECATTQNLGKAFRIRNCTMLHYSGHGNNSSINNSSGVALEDGQGGVQLWSAADMKQFIKVGLQDSLRLVFVSACYSFQTALSFVEAGVPHVIAVHSETRVADDAARTFSGEFYMTLAAGKTVREAFNSGKAAVASAPAAANYRSSCCCCHQHKPGCKGCRLHSSSPTSVVGGSLAACCCDVPHNDDQKFMLLPENGNHNLPVFPHLPLGETLPLPPATLPSVPPHFVGRNCDMYNTIKALLKTKTPLVTIRGSRGIGKTTLAKAVAKYIKDRQMFKDGVIFVPLEGKKTREAIRRSILASLREVRAASSHNGLFSCLSPDNMGRNRLTPVPYEALSEDTSLKGDDELLAELKPLECLIVLDNCDDALNIIPSPETRNDGNDFQQILMRILDNTSHVKILISSCKALDFVKDYGQKVITLRPLSAKDSAWLFLASSPRPVTLAEVAAASSKLAEHRLGNERPQKRMACISALSSSDLQIHADEQVPSHYLAEHPIFKFLGGHPLSICIFSSLLQDKQLNEVYDIVLRARRPSPVLHHSDNSGLETSLAYLKQQSPEAVNLFGLLGQLPGGALARDLDALWPSLSVSDWRPAMNELVSHSFASLHTLNLADSDSLGDISEQFVILPCVLGFARTLLKEDILKDLWPALIEHYSQLCANLYQLMGGPEAKLAYAVFAKEHDNAFWCLSTSLEQIRREGWWDSRKSSPVKEPSHALMLFDHSTLNHNFVPVVTESKVEVSMVLPRPRKMSATALPFSTALATTSTCPPATSSLFAFPSSSSSLMTVFSSPNTTPNTSPVNGPVSFEFRPLPPPSPPPRGSPRLSGSFSTQQDEITALVNLGIYLGLILSLEQQHEDGELALVLGLEAAIRLGDKPGEARCHRNLATLYEQGGLLDQPCRACNTMRNLGCMVAVQHGRHDRALGHCGYALELYRELNQRAGIGDVLQLKADLMRSRDIEAAKVCLTEALAIFEGPGLSASLGRTKVLQSLGDVQVQMENDYDKAKDFYTEAMTIFQAHPDCDKIPVVNLLTSLAEVHTRLGNYKQAHEALSYGLTLAQELEYRQGEGNLCVAWAELFMCENDWDAAEKKCEHARILFEQIGDTQGEGRAQLQALSVHDGRKQAGALIKTAEEASYELEASDSDFPPFDLEAEMSEEERRIYERSLTPVGSPSFSPFTVPGETQTNPSMDLPSSALIPAINSCTALTVITSSPPPSPSNLVGGGFAPEIVVESEA